MLQRRGVETPQVVALLSLDTSAAAYGGGAWACGALATTILARHQRWHQIWRQAWRQRWHLAWLLCRGSSATKWTRARLTQPGAGPAPWTRTALGTAIDRTATSGDPGREAG